MQDTSHFPHACRALLDKLLETGGLLTRANRDRDEQCNYIVADSLEPGRRHRAVLDLGFGCGDQTLHLMNPRGQGKQAKEEAVFDQYVGLTIDQSQCELGRKRIQQAAQSLGKPSYGAVTLFCTDAAKPSSWGLEIKSSIDRAFNQLDDSRERFVLGLDSLYHFYPSRKAIMSYAYSDLNATFLAADLFRATEPEPLTWAYLANLLFFRLICLVLGAPFSNFLTFDDYRAQLQEAGYAYEDITIHDITSHVFPGLASFLNARTSDLAILRLSGFSKWRVAGWLFRWLSGGQVLRFGLVVARWRQKEGYMKA